MNPIDVGIEGHIYLEKPAPNVKGYSRVDLTILGHELSKRKLKERKFLRL